MSVLNCLKSATLAATLSAADGLLASTPMQAQGYAYVDCNNPYYYQYCQAYYARYNQYYDSNGDPYDYPYYPYDLPLGGQAVWKRHEIWGVRSVSALRSSLPAEALSAFQV